MIKVRLKIDDGKPLDTADNYGLIYISSDHRFDAPIKAFEKSTYPEEEGEHIYTQTTKDAFDYKTTWLIKAEGSLESANAMIAKFNSLLYEQEGDVLHFKRVYFYNDYKKVMIVGTPSLISEATEFWRDASGKTHDVVQVEWVIRVSKPSLCNFDLR